MNNDPLAPGSQSIRPQLATENGFVTYTWRKNLEATDLLFSYELSTNLSNWSLATPAEEEVLSNDGATEMIKAKFPIQAGAEFIRLKVIRR
jgi:hypothetical protein